MSPQDCALESHASTLYREPDSRCTGPALWGSSLIQRLAIPDVFVFTPKRFGDDRGFFVETFNRGALEPATGALEWVQDNHSRSTARGTVRGLHFHIAPFAQEKFVRCIRGAILDVAVDIRHGSPTYGKHISTKLRLTVENRSSFPRASRTASLRSRMDVRLPIR